MSSDKTGKVVQFKRIKLESIVDILSKEIDGKELSCFVGLIIRAFEVLGSNFKTGCKRRIRDCVGSNLSSFPRRPFNVKVIVLFFSSNHFFMTCCDSHLGLFVFSSFNGVLALSTRLLQTARIRR